jgi:hypothetical protein
LKPTSKRGARALACVAPLAAALLLALAVPTVAAPRGAGPGLRAAPVWTIEGTQADGRYGTVAPAGDVNGDGYADVLVGAYNEDHPEADEGVVRLHLGGFSGLSPTPAWLGECGQAGARLGDKLSGAGDVNGDGYDDVIVGAGLYDTPAGTDAGAAFLWLGSATGLQPAPAWNALGDQANAQFGACAQAAGDVNGDGYGDVIVGAWLCDHGETDEGRAFVYFGSDTGLAATPGWIGESNSTSAVFGYFCASAGDVNGDGYDDIVVGARRFSGNGLTNEGRVYVYLGSPAGPHATADWTYDGGVAKSEVGAYCISAGDVNGDGYDDLLVGAFRWDHPGTDAGKAMLFAGSASGLASSPAWTVEGAAAHDQFGYHLDSAGDVNHDGYDDVVVSASYADTYGGAFVDAGRASLFLGSPSGLSPAPAWTQEGDQAGMTLEVVRGVGDVNGDGYADVGTGALYHDGVLADAGEAWVFYGSPDDGAGVGSGDGATTRLAVTGPNPARPATALSFALARAGRARLAAYDVAGRRVATLFDGAATQGEHRVAWLGRGDDGAALAPGVYLARLETADGARSVKLLLLR